MTLIDSYNEINQSSQIAMNNDVADNYASEVGQVITIGSVSGILTSVKFFLKRIGNPTGDIFVDIIAVGQGVVGTNGRPADANIVLIESDVIDVSTVSTSYSLVEFTFSTQYQLLPNMSYCLNLVYNIADTPTDYIAVGTDNTTPTHAGNGYYFLSTTYIATTDDIIFYLYGSISSTILNSQSNIKINNSNEIIRRLLVENWQIGSLAMPIIKAITDVKRITYRDSSGILIYEINYASKKEGFNYNFRDRIVTISIDIRTKNGYQALKILEDEVLRIFHNNRKDPAPGFDYLNIVRRTDLSDKSRRIYQVVLDVELKDLVDVIL